MNAFTIGDIRRLGPCYDPSRYLPEDWSGTALDILAVEECPAADRLWVVLHSGWIPDRTMRLFAVWCARQALALVDNRDPRSVAACDTAERFANGLATDKELASAWVAANAAASAAAWDAASDAASDAARAAAWDAASDAAWDAASDAAWAAQVEQLRAMLTETQ